VASTTRRIVSAFSRLGIVVIIVVAFTFGLVGTVYLSLRSPKIQVPDIVNKQYLEGETTLEKAGLSMRERARRYKPDVAPGTILDQSPRAGEVVKAGQTIAVVVSRARKEGEQPPSEEVAAERKKEETGESRNTSELTKNENRRRNKNANANANSNANSAANTNTNTNVDDDQGTSNTSTANRNSVDTTPRNTNLGGNSNRALNANRNTNESPRPPRNANLRPATVEGNRNTRPTRTVPSSNRRPNP
jgi:beta-lactam-binding protein with PASTA domain